MYIHIREELLKTRDQGRQELPSSFKVLLKTSHLQGPDFCFFHVHLAIKSVYTPNGSRNHGCAQPKQVESNCTELARLLKQSRYLPNCQDFYYKSSITK